MAGFESHSRRSYLSGSSPNSPFRYKYCNLFSLGKEGARVKLHYQISSFLLHLESFIHMLKIWMVKDTTELKNPGQVNQPLRLLESVLNPYTTFEKKLDLLEAKLDSLISIYKGKPPETDSANSQNKI